MNAIQEVREEYKMATREYVRHIPPSSSRFRSPEYYEGLMNGIKRALSCLGVTSDEIEEMYNTSAEEVKDEKANEGIGPGDVSYDEEGFVKDNTTPAIDIERPITDEVADAITKEAEEYHKRKEQGAGA